MEKFVAISAARSLPVTQASGFLSGHRRPVQDISAYADGEDVARRSGLSADPLL
jgi:hypothetical protein